MGQHILTLKYLLHPKLHNTPSDPVDLLDYCIKTLKYLPLPEILNFVTEFQTAQSTVAQSVCGIVNQYQDVFIDGDFKAQVSYTE